MNSRHDAVAGGIGVADGPKKYIGSPMNDDCACNSNALRRPIAEHDASDFNIDIERPNLNADADAMGYEVIVAKSTYENIRAKTTM